MANFDKSNWKSFDGREVQPGETLVPQLVTEEDAALCGAKKENLRTWTRGGVSYTVMFIPVPADQEKVSLQAFNFSLNELLDEKLGSNRHSRCLIPQEDGAMKVCPKKSGDNHASCTQCPHKYNYEKEDRSTVSTSALDEYGYDFGSSPSAEDEAMEKILLAELIEELTVKDPRLAEIVRLGYAGYKKREILDKLGVSKSQAYNLYNLAYRFAEAFLIR